MTVKVNVPKIFSKKNSQISVLPVPFQLLVHLLAAHTEMVVVPVVLADSAEFGVALQALEHFVDPLVHLHDHGVVAALAPENYGKLIFG